MRDPERIKPFLKKIEEQWMDNTDFRFGQLIMCITKTEESNPKLFHMEEDEFSEKIEILKKQLKTEHNNIVLYEHH